MTTSPLDRHRSTPAKDSVLDFLSYLSQFREDFTAHIEIACNYLNRDEANRTPRMVTGSRSVRTSHPIDDGAWFHGQVLVRRRRFLPQSTPSRLFPRVRSDPDRSRSLLHLIHSGGRRSNPVGDCLHIWKTSCNKVKNHPSADCGGRKRRIKRGTSGNGRGRGTEKRRRRGKIGGKQPSL
jgi:hypothetical protein